MGKAGLGHVSTTSPILMFFHYSAQIGKSQQQWAPVASYLCPPRTQAWLVYIQHFQNMAQVPSTFVLFVHLLAIGSVPRF